MGNVIDRSNWPPAHIQKIQGHVEGHRHLLAQKYTYFCPKAWKITYIIYFFMIMWFFKSIFEINVSQALFAKSSFDSVSLHGIAIALRHTCIYVHNSV